MFDRTIEILGGRTDVVVRDGALNAIADLLAEGGQTEQPSAALVVTDTNVGPLYAGRVADSLKQGGWAVAVHRIPAGEPSKSIEALEGVCGALAGGGIHRDGLLVAVGGGVVSDLSGLGAALWMRGINWAICPTTLESAIDASIGGKTAVNVASGKNLVGAYHQPVVVAVDPVCLETLDLRDVRAGLAESVKHALITPGDFFDWHESNAGAIATLDGAIRGELLRRNIGVKADVVSQDPHEKSGMRETLNLGHTVGHAIEACCGYRLRHGECVALGLVACVRISRELGILPAEEVDRIERLLSTLGLPVALRDVLQDAADWSSIWSAMRHDKKSRGGAIRFVLLDGIGSTVTRRDLPESVVRGAYESLLA